ncbi:MAG: DUF805 domain-containing protein [Bacteroidota bacterium]
MTFAEAITTCFTKYADFSGRASRSEYWWWSLFVILASMAAGILNQQLAALFSLATVLPSLAVGTRRLHDIDRSGWLQLLFLVPLLGWIVLAYLSAQAGKEPNRY